MLACTPMPALAGVPGATGTYGGGLESKCSTVFAGTYTDPINHPGGTRKISLNPDFERPAVIFGQRLATVSGGGGRGEPAEYVLPATISTDDKKITIDFAPKGGPPDFPGVFETQADGTAGIRMGTATVLPEAARAASEWGSGGLAAVWAEENTRDSIFESCALKGRVGASLPR